jgi:DNA-binding transcriptional MerR regulator
MAAFSYATRMRVLYVDDVAALAGLPPRTIRHWAATGRLPAQKLGAKIWTFDAAIVADFLRRVVRCKDRKRKGVQDAI